MFASTILKVRVFRLRLRKKTGSVLLLVSLFSLTAAAFQIVAAQVYIDLQDQFPASLAYSLDGKYLVGGGHDGTIRFWEAKSWKPFYLIYISDPRPTFEGKEFPVSPGVMSVAFSRDGRLLATGIRDRTVRVWDTEKRLQITVFSGHEGGLRSVGFSPDGKSIVSGGHDGTVRIWRLTPESPTGKVIGRHEEMVTAVTFNPAGSRIASSSLDGTVHLWSITEHETPSVAIFNAHSSVTSMAFSPDGGIVAGGTTGSNPFVVFWDVQTGQEIKRLLGHTGGINGIAFSPNGQRLISGDYNGGLRLWDVQTGKLVWSVVVPANAPDGDLGVALRAVAFSPDGNFIACGGSPGNPHLFDAKSGKHLGMLP
jgi:WD40 repeat protein